MNTQEPHPKARPTDAHEGPMWDDLFDEDAFNPTKSAHELTEGQRQCPKCGGTLILMRWIAHPKHKSEWVCTGKDHYTPAGRAALHPDTDTDAGKQGRGGEA